MVGKGGNETILGQMLSLLAAAGSRSFACEGFAGDGLVSNRESGSRSAGKSKPCMLCCALLLILLLLSGCVPTWERPRSYLANQGTALYELPFALEQPTGIRPGRYSMSVDVIYTATQEEATQRCNFGMPGGSSLACYLEKGNIIITPVPVNSNDWTSMCYLGHEVTHGTHGAWHP